MASFKKGNVPLNTGKGKSYAWIVEHVGYQGDDCLQWPFSVRDGRGKVAYMGRRHYASRVMCQLAHGDPPTPQHEAAHECGNGHLRCMNPKHLKWKTKADNVLDTVKHGTHPQRRVTRSLLTYEQAEEIRALKGKEKLYVVAQRYGISNSAVDHIWKGRTYRKPDRYNPPWTPDEDAKLRIAVERGMSKKETAEFVGRFAGNLWKRKAKLGLSTRN